MSTPFFSLTALANTPHTILNGIGAISNLWPFFFHPLGTCWPELRADAWNPPKNTHLQNRMPGGEVHPLRFLRILHGVPGHIQFENGSKKSSPLWMLLTCGLLAASQGRGSADKPRGDLISHTFGRGAPGCHAPSYQPGAEEAVGWEQTPPLPPALPRQPARERRRAPVRTRLHSWS